MDELSREDPVLWSYWYRRLRGKPLTYDVAKLLTPQALAELKATSTVGDYRLALDERLLRHRPFLMQPLRDMHPHKAYMKARQVGVSEVELTEVIHFLYSHDNTKFVITFPREKQLLDFATTRIAPAFLETPRIAALLGIPNQVTTKKIGNSHLILRSAWESGLGEGIDADGVTLDEKDRMKDGVEVAFKESMKSSRWKLLREISTPSVPGRGVDKPFSASDQQVWLVRCTKCNLEQEIAYPDNIVQVKEIPLGTRELPADSYDFLCRLVKCRGKLNRMQGRWVPRYPDRKMIRGYHIPQTIAPWITATGIMQDKLNTPFLSMWYNYVLGLPARGDQILLVAEDFERASAGHDLQYTRAQVWSRISVGIDWGHLNWVVVMGKNAKNNRDYVIGIAVFEDEHEEEMKSTKAVADYVASFDPDVIIADAGYGKDRNSYMLRRFSPNGIGKFWACTYNPQAKSSRTFVPEWSTPDRARVLVDRTVALKTLCRALRQREFGIPNLSIDLVQLLKNHFLALVPRHEQADEGGEVVEIVTNSGPDHLAHATGYARLGMMRLSENSSWSFDFIG